MAVLLKIEKGRQTVIQQSRLEADYCTVLKVCKTAAAFEFLIAHQG